jgi:hypothetical protein
MLTNSFDFDVITGPSTPREERDEAHPQKQAQPQPAEIEPAAPQTR